MSPQSLTLGLQITQNRSCLCTLGPKLGTVYILGVLGLGKDTYLGLKLFTTARVLRLKDLEARDRAVDDLGEDVVVACLPGGSNVIPFWLWPICCSGIIIYYQKRNYIGALG